MYDKNYRSSHVYLANLLVATLFFFIAPVAKAQGVFIDLGKQSATLPYADGKELDIHVLYPGGLLLNGNRASIRFFEATDYACSELLQAFLIGPEDVITRNSTPGDVCTVRRANGSFVNLPHWEVKHYNDPLLFVRLEDDNVCLVFHEVWCQDY